MVLKSRLKETLDGFVCIVERGTELVTPRKGAPELKEVIKEVHSIKRRFNVSPADLKSADNPDGRYETMKQAYLAIASGLAPNVVSNFANLQRSVINIEHLTKIANTLKIKDIRELVEFT